MLARTGIKYPSNLHCEKVASFLSTKARHNAIILAKGSEIKNRDNTDNELDFRQESNFFYLTGVQEPGCYFIYDLARKRTYLIVPNPDPVRGIWKGPDLTDSQLLCKYDVHRVVHYSGLLHLLKRELQPQQIHGLNNPEQGLAFGDKAMERELQLYISHRLVHPKGRANQADEEQLADYDKHRPHHHGPSGDHHGHRGDHHCDHRDHCDHHHHHHHHCDHPEDPKEEITLFKALILARIHKTPIEIALSREATRITSDAHRLVMKSVRPGLFEYQLEALFRYECARQGAKAQTYLPIVGTGVNAAYLHYTRNDTQIKDGQLILVDAACEADCYGSDVTRTFPVNGQFSPEQADIYNLVLEMQNVS
jgi:Xaa-Pro aminopeptidase